MDKFLKAFLITFFSIIVVVYGAFTVLNYLYFAPGTVVNGMDLSFKSVEKAESILDYTEFQTEVIFRDGSMSVYGKDIDFSAKVDTELMKLKNEQNPFLWFMFWDRKPVSFDFTVDLSDSKLRSVLKASRFLDETKEKKPENASVIVNDNTVSINEGDPGTTIIEDRLVNELYDSIKNLQRTYYVSEECYEKPLYASDSEKVQNCFKEVNEYLELDIKYIFGDFAYPLTKDQLYSMVSISDNYQVTIRRDVVQKFVEDFAAEHNTFGNSKRRFKTHSGRTAVIDGSNYGWEIDVEAETEELYRLISNKFSADRIPSFTHKAFTYGYNGDDIGGNFVEVDLGNQHVYVYKDGKVIIDCDCVSGNMAQGHGTPSGVYAIRAKLSPTILRGDDYESPVDYWMPFYGGIGLHDANWRGRFGGEIYKTNGSHGCVNLPPSIAGDIYRNVTVGTPVVLYWNSDLE